MSKFEVILELGVKKEASDIFIKDGQHPCFRLAGRVLQQTEIDKLTEVDVQQMFDQIADTRVKRIFSEHGEADFAYNFPPWGRFRINVYRTKQTTALAIRVIKPKIPALDSLKVPTEVLKKLAGERRGLVLVTGVTGSGKSTTLASMIDYVNENFEKHIITLEDPIEFMFQDKKSIVEQREVGIDSSSFEDALKHVVRQNPDIIFIGELRDRETIEAGVHAAETGHLVFSTLHTQNAPATMERILNFFPPHQQTFLFQQLAALVQGVVSMRLLPTKDMKSRVPAMQIMVATPTVRELIYNGKVREINKALKEGEYFGCQTFNKSLMGLINEDMITIEDAMANADQPEELKLALRGFTRGMDKKR